jgi:membrane associated rhomboid family serine protease
MIPLRDDNPTQSKPYVVYALIIANVVVFAAQALANQFGNLTMIPYSVVHDVRVGLLVNQYGQAAIGPHGKILFDQFPAIGPHPQWITIFTSMFMHGSLMHTGGNMLYLWIFGNNIEDALGHVKFALFYIVCGVLAAGLHMFASMHGVGAFIPTLGASGAIAGVLGAYIVLYPKSKVGTLIMLGWWWEMVDIPAIFVLGVWFVLQLTGVLGTGGMLGGGGVAYWAHVGGFVAGMLLILMLGGKKLTGRWRPPPQNPWNEGRPYPFRPWK